MYIYIYVYIFEKKYIYKSKFSPFLFCLQDALQVHDWLPALRAFIAIQSASPTPNEFSRHSSGELSSRRRRTGNGGADAAGDPRALTKVLAELIRFVTISDNPGTYAHLRIHI